MSGLAGGVNKVVGVQVDYDHFEDELQAEGFTVISNAWPSDLTGMDCFMGEFWNSYSNAENAGLEAFMLSEADRFLVDTRGTGLTQTMMWLTTTPK